jgi:hypothetical protein
MENAPVLAGCVVAGSESARKLVVVNNPHKAAEITVTINVCLRSTIRIESYLKRRRN